jgi:hypothetical protein
MRRRLRLRCFLLTLLLAAPLPAQADPLLDDLEDIDGWTVVTSEGAHLDIVSDVGYRGRGMRLDFDFQAGGGYVNVQRSVSIPLPGNYAFSFYLRGEALPNSFEFKLVDESGQNVWWQNRRDYEFPSKWQRLRVKKSRLEFAWGPSGGAVLHHVGAIEFTIAAGSGGKGSVWIDEIRLDEKDTDGNGDLTPQVSASTSAEGYAPAAVLEVPSGPGWKSEPVARPQWLLIDFGKAHEYGGLVIDWDAEDFATAYEVMTSEDGIRWEQTRENQAGNGGRDYIYMPDAESRYVKIDLERSSRGQGYGIRSIEVKPFEFSASPNHFFTAIAADAPTGWFPKYFTGKQTYWTVLGVDGDEKVALLNEEGMLEVDVGAFSIEPFLLLGDRLVTWADASQTLSLEDGYLPIPSVSWQADPLRLDITAFAAGKVGKSIAYARYRVTNQGDTPAETTLFLTVRPFQVNPPWQSLQRSGGTSPIHSIIFENRFVRVGSDRVILFLTPPQAVGASTFDEGGIPEKLSRDNVPSGREVFDEFGYASAAMRYPLTLPPGESRDVYIAIPFHDPQPFVADLHAPTSAADEFTKRLEEAETYWRKVLERVVFQLPPSAEKMSLALKSAVAQILINREGPAIHPGPRNYARSWIRDGAVTSSALLEVGVPQPAADFLRWFSTYQFASGKVPCCVDRRGADPTAEHDSHGELIYGVAEYYRFTRDVGFVADLWPHVTAAADYIEQLRAQRLTDQFSSGEGLLFYGLLPESISHEGYASNPPHSYWDDFFALRGLSDAAFLGRVVGDTDREKKYANLRDDFRRDLYASIERSMARHQIDYIPGAAERGDFDASSTAIALAPVGELENLPQPALTNTFDRYYQYFDDRRNGRIDWEAYTPYELRNVTALLLLNQPERAFEVLEYLVDAQRPPAWNQWQEIFWRDGAAPKFIGDMPHTWIGSGYIRAVRSLFAYERESDDALVLGAGLPPSWIDDPAGVGVDRLPTYYGTLNMKVRREDASTVRVVLRGDIQVPAGRIVVRLPVGKPLESVRVNGTAVDTFDASSATIDRFPADVELRY